MRFFSKLRIFVATRRWPRGKLYGGGLVAVTDAELREALLRVITQVDFYLVEQFNHPAFCRDVNEMLCQGWALHGPVTATQLYDPVTDAWTFYYAAALVRPQRGVTDG
jgi:hypothetical protein